jgi:hypothetical protein
MIPKADIYTVLFFLPFEIKCRYKLSLRKGCLCSLTLSFPFLSVIFYRRSYGLLPASHWPIRDVDCCQGPLNTTDSVFRFLQMLAVIPMINKSVQSKHLNCVRLI